jgi:ATP synthase protein I
MSNQRETRSDPWADADDEANNAPIKPLTREEVRDLKARHPAVSPWRVVGLQGLVGLLMGLAVVVAGKQMWLWSVLYGAATAVVPGVLMARGMTSQLTSLSPGVSAVSFMLWEFGKIGVSIAMLMLAPKLVPALSWPAMLVALAVCIKVYWVALSWRRRTQH